MYVQIKGVELEVAASSSVRHAVRCGDTSERGVIRGADRDRSSPGDVRVCRWSACMHGKRHSKLVAIGSNLQLAMAMEPHCTAEMYMSGKELITEKPQVQLCYIQLCICHCGIAT